MMRENKVLVTGGLGLVGSSLVRLLLDKGLEVSIVDNKKSAIGGYENLVDGAHIFTGDIENASTLQQLPACPWRTVYHLAAQADVPKSVRDPLEDFRINAMGTMNLLEWSRKNDVKRFVYASSVAVYDPAVSKPITETAQVCPSSPYGASKLAGEAQVMAYHRTFGISTCILRLFNVYGPGMNKYVIHDLVRKLQGNDKVLEILGSGRQVRDYVYVTDAAEAFYVAAERGREGSILNMGSGCGISIAELADAIILAMGLKGVEKQFTGASWAGDIDAWFADASKLQALGWQPRIGLPEGLRSTVQSLQKHKPPAGWEVPGKCP